MVLISVRFKLNQNQDYMEILNAVASRLQLEMKTASSYGTSEFRGIVNGHTVTMYIEEISEGRSSVTALVLETSLHEAKLPSFSISSLSIVSNINRMLGGKEILTGDDDFDSTVVVESADKYPVLALLSARSRALIKEFMFSAYKHKFSISNEKITQYLEFGKLPGAEEIVCQINQQLLLADLLQRKGTITELFARNFMNESVYATKLQLLASLLAVGASFAKDDPLIKKALTDNEMDIRINGAKLLGKAGFDYVYDIYEHAYDDIKAKIIGYYTACKEAIFLDFFLGKARTEAREVRAELVDYFGAIKSPKAEPFLLEELDSALSSTDVRSDTDFILKVIRALAECGTFKSIEILYSITNIGIKRDAEAAIAIIQARLGTGDSGWLSLPEAAAGFSGGLSLSDPENAEDT